MKVIGIEVEFSDKYGPVRGHEWELVSGSNADASMLLLEREFIKKAGEKAKREDWILFILNGWYLRENQHKNGTKFIDTCYAFVPKSATIDDGKG